jgi:hypothetical protein
LNILFTVKELSNNPIDHFVVLWRTGGEAQQLIGSSRVPFISWHDINIKYIQISYRELWWLVQLALVIAM